MVLVAVPRNRTSLVASRCWSILSRKTLKFRLTLYLSNRCVSVTTTRPCSVVRKMVRSASFQFRIKIARRRIKICLRFNTVRLFWSSKLTGTRYNQRSSICKLRLNKWKRTRQIKLRISVNKKRLKLLSYRTRLKTREMKMLISMRLWRCKKKKWKECTMNAKHKWWKTTQWSSKKEWRSRPKKLKLISSASWISTTPKWLKTPSTRWVSKISPKFRNKRLRRCSVTTSWKKIIWKQTKKPYLRRSKWW